MPLSITLIRGLCLGVVGLWAGQAMAQVAPGPRAPLPVPSLGQVVPGPLAPLPIPSLGPVEPSPPPRATARWELEGGLLGGFYSIRYDQPADPSTPPERTTGDRGSAGLTLTRFMTPVVDDETPRSLQPFLQRTTSLQGSLEGGGFVTLNPITGPLSPRQNRTDTNVTMNLGLDVYLTPVVALTAALGYEHDDLQDFGVDQTTHAFTAGLGFGVRIDDVRIDLAYAMSAIDTNGTFAPLRVGRAELSIFAVAAKRVSLHPYAFALRGGGGGGADLGFYPSKGVGILVGGFGERGVLDTNSDAVSARYGGDVGAAIWILPRMRLSAYYDLTAVQEPTPTLPTEQTLGYLEVEHAFSIHAALRLP